MNQTSLKKKYGFEFPFIPDPLVKKSIRYIKGGRLLDIGCGEGADSVFFAQKGLRITALDRNEEYLIRFRRYRNDHSLSNITILNRDALKFGYPPRTYDAISCILVPCCMKKSDFEKILPSIKRAVKIGGIVVMSARNYLDAEFSDYRSTGKPIEPNTFRAKEDCCKFVYFMEKNRLRELFSDFDILYYYEGSAPCKYNEHPEHGDSHIICKRKK